MKPIAILTSDWHLWPNAPSYRREEEDWFSVYRRVFERMSFFQKRFDIPVLVAGDIFDSYNANPETINFLIENLPDRCYAIPGQHDLQNHVLENIRKTAFWTVVKSGKMTLLDETALGFQRHAFQMGRNLRVWGYGWECSTNDLFPEKQENTINIAVCHRYICSSKEDSYQGCSEDKFVSKLEKEFWFFDLCVFGDNHIPFKSGKFINCGTLLCRKRDEDPLKAGFWLLMEDLSVKRVLTVWKDDKYTEDESVKIQKKNFYSEFLDSLKTENLEKFDFEWEIKKECESRDNPKITETVNSIFTKHKEK